MCKSGEDRELMTDAEFAAALADATVRGLIKWLGDEEVALTDKGIDYAYKLRESLGDMNYLIMQMLFEQVREIAEKEQQE